MTDDNINNIKELGLKWIEQILKSDITYTKPGSISYLIYGKKPSEQSINIKLGHFGEFLSKELIKLNSNLELLNCGIQKINDNKNKDIELDTEKLPATISKCLEIEKTLKDNYIDYKINSGILNWSIYNRNILTSGLSNIKKFENNAILIDHIEDFLKIIDIKWIEEDYYSYFREIGNIIKKRY